MYASYIIEYILTRVVDLDDLGTVTLAGMDMMILILVSKAIAGHGAAITTAAATTITTTTTEFHEMNNMYNDSIGE